MLALRANPTAPNMGTTVLILHRPLFHFTAHHLWIRAQFEFPETLKISINVQPPTSSFLGSSKGRGNPSKKSCIFPFALKKILTRHLYHWIVLERTQDARSKPYTTPHTNCMVWTKLPISYWHFCEPLGFSCCVPEKLIVISVMLFSVWKFSIKLLSPREEDNMPREKSTHLSHQCSAMDQIFQPIEVGCFLLQGSNHTFPAGLRYLVSFPWSKCDRASFPRQGKLLIFSTMPSINSLHPFFWAEVGRHIWFTIPPL